LKRDLQEEAMKAIPVAALLMGLLPVQAISQESKAEFEQQQFADAYNRKDVEAMAMAFSEDAVRVTPASVFRGRDEIRRSFQEALKLGLQDYAVRRTDSRTYGDVVLTVGEWQAKLGNNPFHGYYTSILGREGDQIKILEETVTVCA
jgi:ketosteroid isomerase-like protein